MKCGEVVLVTFPFTDLSGSKVRPTVVVSADDYNRGDDVVVVPISSVPDASDPHSFLLASSDPAFRNTGLRQTSSVKWTKPLTIAKRVIQRRLGALGSESLRNIQLNIQGVFRS